MEGTKTSLADWGGTEALAKAKTPEDVAASFWIALRLTSWTSLYLISAGNAPILSMRGKILTSPGSKA